MLYPAFALIAGFAALAWAADKFVDGAVGISRNAGIAPIVIGLVIMGFGTSAPEMLVSAMAAWDGEPSIAIGNALGSNTSNLTLILGGAALVKPLLVHSTVLKREFPLLLLVSLLAWGAMADGHLGRLEGLGLFGLLGVVMGVLVSLARKGRTDPMVVEVVAELPPPMSSRRAWLLTLGALALLVVSSRVLVWGAVEIATLLGIDTLVISLTIVAVGTSLPELAASVASALKGESDLAVGNVVGSNLFNTLAVIGIAATVKPFEIPAPALQRDMPIMFGLTVLVLLMNTGLGRKGRIDRREAVLLLACFVSYQVLLFATA